MADFVGQDGGLSHLTMTGEGVCVADCDVPAVAEQPASSEGMALRLTVRMLPKGTNLKSAHRAVAEELANIVRGGQVVESTWWPSLVLVVGKVVYHLHLRTAGIPYNLQLGRKGWEEERVWAQDRGWELRSLWVTVDEEEETWIIREHPYMPGDPQHKYPAVIDEEQVTEWPFRVVRGQVVVGLQQG